MDDTPADAASPVESPAPKAACVLLLDVSEAMSGEPLEALSRGLALYSRALSTDRLVSKRVEVAVVAFGGESRPLCEFSTSEDFRAPQLTPGGDSPMGTAIHQGIDLVQERKQYYWASRLAFHRPWVFLISGSAPTDLWRSAADRLRQGEASRAFSLFAVGVERADFDVLRRLTTREPLRLKDRRFEDLFLWLSESQRAVARSVPGARVALQNPAKADGWAVAELSDEAQRERRA